MDEAGSLVLKLLGKSPVSTIRICAGKNSRVYLVECDKGDVFAVKFYLHPIADGRNRLEQEWAALSFMEKAGISTVPKPIACDHELQGGVYSFLDGKRILGRKGHEVAELLDFINELKVHSAGNGALDVGLAAEACLSPSDLVGNILQRKEKLDRLPNSDELFAEMHKFLDGRFSVDFGESFKAAKETFLGERWDEKLPHEKRTLSPSDFGFHNVLERDDGRLVFLDFEYFGWDDPVKATSDFLLHPAMTLSDNEVREFYEGMKKIFATDEDFEERFKVFLPLFRLKWCLILLNEFFNDALNRRRFASGSEETDQDMRRRQLTKAQRFLSKDKEIFGVLFPEERVGRVTRKINMAQ
ncbi:phosphotransferase [Maridesulfovibrio sp. FT414]|uniref:phosphotransferase n=1 Tax=Maridesulfovibrio sp. FT414 TaxID=2979469 RepID=UPI003D8074F8